MWYQPIPQPSRASCRDSRRVTCNSFFFISVQYPAKTRINEINISFSLLASPSGRKSVPAGRAGDSQSLDSRCAASASVPANFRTAEMPDCACAVCVCPVGTISTDVSPRLCMRAAAHRDQILCISEHDVLALTPLRTIPANGLRAARLWPACCPRPPRLQCCARHKPTGTLPPRPECCPRPPPAPRPPPLALPNLLPQSPRTFASASPHDETGS